MTAPTPQPITAAETLKVRADTLVNILAPDQGEGLTDDQRRLFAIASAIQADADQLLTELSTLRECVRLDGELLRKVAGTQPKEDNPYLWRWIEQVKIAARARLSGREGV